MAMGTTNAVGGEALKPVSTSMEIYFDSELPIYNACNRVRWNIVPKDGGSIPAGTLEFRFTYTIIDNDKIIMKTGRNSIQVTAGNYAFGFIEEPSSAKSITQVANCTFKDGSTIYASRDSIPFPVDYDNKVNKNQGTANAGKVLGIGSDGMVTPVDAGGFGEWTKITALSELSSNLTLGKTLVAKRLECANNITVVGVNVVALETVAGRLICYGSFSGVLKNGDFYSGMGSYIAFSSGRLIANVLANDSSTEYVVQNFDTMFIR